MTPGQEFAVLCLPVLVAVLLLLAFFVDAYLLDVGGWAVAAAQQKAADEELVDDGLTALLDAVAEPGAAHTRRYVGTHRWEMSR